MELNTWCRCLFVFYCFFEHFSYAATPLGRSVPECISNCENQHEKSSITSAKQRWVMPLANLGDKQYYLGIFLRYIYYIFKLQILH
uniref:Secreted protein n=1 Tax=Strigamia maritima TaxID=126957 RepID=T1IY97_STRMM